MIQNFSRSLGFAPKGYSLLHLKDKPKIILITGIKSNFKYLKDKLEKYSKTKVTCFRVDKKKISYLSLKQMQKKINKIKPNVIISLGGGTIIDFSKRIAGQIKKVKFYIFPSLPGSGAESSITSILNIKNEKKILVDEKFMPDGIIYDETFFYSCPKNLILRGIADSLTHCIESTLTINGNYYLNFLSVETVNQFIKQNSVKNLISAKPKNINNINLLSFNGGLSQCNAGSGLCHALSHAAEKLTAESHTKCISFFIYPVMLYLLKKNKKEMSKFNKKIMEYIIDLTKEIQKRESFSKLNEYVKNEQTFKKIIEYAKNDPCWRLYKKNININLLKTLIKNAKIKN